MNKQTTAAVSRIQELAQVGVAMSREERDIRIELNQRVDAGDQDALRALNILNFGKP